MEGGNMTMTFLVGETDQMKMSLHWEKGGDENR